MNGTLKRYFDIFLYALISAVILHGLSHIEILSEGLTTWTFFYASFINIINQSVLSLNSDSFFSIQDVIFILIGLGITRIQSSLLIYNAKRPFMPSFKFPPLTFAMILGLFMLSWGKLPLPAELIVQYWSFIFGLALTPTYHSYLKAFKYIQDHFIRNKQAQAGNTHLPLTCYDILDTNQQYVVDELTQLFSSNSNQQIAICGAFGVGKSSVIKVLYNKLDKGKCSTKRKYVFCNLDLWGVETDSIIEFVLQNVVSTLAQYVDMSDQKGLPQSYLIAMAEGGKGTKILASFLKEQNSPEQLFQKIDDILHVKNLHLIISIQDLDRNITADKSLNVLAGMLERFKQQKNISYLFAAENTPTFSNTIRRVCPTRVDVLQPNILNKLNDLVENLTAKAQLPESYLQHTMVLYKPSNSSQLINLLIPSYRDWTQFRLEIEKLWSQDKLLGEVQLWDLMVMQALKRTYPKLLDFMIELLSGRVPTENLTLDSLYLTYFQDSSPNEQYIIAETLIHFQFLNKVAHLLAMKNTKENKNTPIGIKKALTGNNKECLALVNTDRLNMLLRGFRSPDNCSLVNVFELLIKIANGDKKALKTLAEALSNETLKAHYFKAMNDFGISILTKQINSQVMVFELLKVLISAPSNEDSFALLDRLGRYLKYEKANSIFHEYFKSDRFTDKDFETILPLFQMDTFLVITDIISNDAEVLKQVNNTLVQQLLKIDSSLSIAILLSSAYGTYHGHLKHILWNEHINQGVLVRVIEQLKSFDKSTAMQGMNQLFPTRVDNSYWLEKLFDESIRYLESTSIRN
ncbi:MAG: P-loop NTPase fold protein [Parashewanella sp.]